MQILISVEENYSKTILNLLRNLKEGIIKELKIIDNIPQNKNKAEILNRAKGLLKNKNINPIEYQKKLREEWENF